MQITIAKLPVTIADRYKEGHKINAVEALALNRLIAENIGNNTRVKIQDLASEDGTFTDAASKKAQELVTAYDDEYELTAAGTRRASVDPVERKAIAIAKSIVGDQLKEQGFKSVKEFLANEDKAQERFDAAVDKVASNPKVIAKAKELVVADAKAKADKEKLKAELAS